MNLAYDRNRSTRTFDNGDKTCCTDPDIALTRGELHEILREAQRQKEAMEREQGFFFSDERKRAMFD